MPPRVELSDSQKAAVEAPWAASKHMILSTAGSGKTLVLTHRAVKIAKDLVAQGARNERILCVCFNKAMAVEMHHRIQQLVRAESLTAAVHVSRTTHTASSVVTIEVRTFHGLGNYILLSSTQAQRALVGLPPGYLKVLQGAALRRGFFQALKAAGQLASFPNEKAAKSTITAKLKDVEEFKGRTFDRGCEHLMMTGTWPPELDSTAPPDMDVYEGYLYENCATDFTDMIWKAVRLILNCDRMRERLARRYATVLVDEFQDLSAAQLLLCQTLVSVSQSVTLVGDDDQQIYSFRTGNNWFCHKAAQHVFPDITTLTLPENRRCPGSVVHAARALIMHNEDRAEKDIVPTRADGLPVHVVGCQSLDLEKDFVIAAVERLLPGLERDGGRVLILFRINELLLDFQKTLKEAGIETTRRIRTEVTTRPIGTRTLTVLAMLTLMSAKTSRDEFVWAATNVSAHIQKSFMEHVLSASNAERDAGQTNRNGHRERSDGEVLIVDGGIEDIDDDVVVEEPPANSRQKRDPYPSPYLRQVTDWYSTRCNNREQGGEENTMLEPIRILLHRADTLRMELDNAQSVEELLRHAEAALDADVTSTGASQESVGEADFHDGSQSSQGGDERVGLDALVDAAARVDAKLRRKMKRDSSQQASQTPRQKARRARVDDDDDDDFQDNGVSQLLSADLQMSAQKRRRVQGLAGSARSVRGLGGSAAVERIRGDQLGQCISDFCDTARRKLQALERGGGGAEQKEESGRRRRKAADAEDEARTVLSTVHNAKGSTFQHVFLCGANKYNMPNAVMVMGGGAPMGALVEPGNLPANGMHCQEERRVFFVAQTRATRQVFVTYSADRDGRGVRIKDFESMFLTEMLKRRGEERGPCFAVESFVEHAGDISKAVARDTAQVKREIEREARKQATPAAKQEKAEVKSAVAKSEEE